jgi:hypothetical protein
MEEKINSTKMNRRKFLKLLAASGASMTALALVPDKWVKPVLGSGVLPVHAASSSIVQSPSISNSSVDYLSGQLIGYESQNLLVAYSPLTGTTSHAWVTFDYNDPMGQVSNSTLVYLLMGGTIGTLSGNLGTYAGDAYNDTVNGYSFSFSNSATPGGTGYTLYISVNGRSSDNATGTFNELPIDHQLPPAQNGLM